MNFKEYVHSDKKYMTLCRICDCIFDHLENMRDVGRSHRWHEQWTRFMGYRDTRLRELRAEYDSMKKAA